MLAVWQKLQSARGLNGIWYAQGLSPPQRLLLARLFLALVLGQMVQAFQRRLRPQEMVQVFQRHLRPQRNVLLGRVAKNAHSSD